MKLYQFLRRIIRCYGSLMILNSDVIKFPFEILPDVANAVVIRNNQIQCQNTIIKPLQVIGKGGGGTVYNANLLSTENLRNPYTEVVFKVGYPKSKFSVTNECVILKHLESRHVHGVEKCLSLCDYNLVESTEDTISVANSAVAIVLSPYFNVQPPNTVFGSLSSLSTFNPNNLMNIQQIATHNLIDICTDILAAGVASSDLQYLVDSSTGNVLVIDFTEARIIHDDDTVVTDNNTKFLNQLLAKNFISELRSNIPLNMMINDNECVKGDNTAGSFKLKSASVTATATSNNEDGHEQISSLTMNDYLDSVIERKLKVLPFYSFLFDS